MISQLMEKKLFKLLIKVVFKQKNEEELLREEIFAAFLWV